MILEPVKKRNIRTLGSFKRKCVPDIGQNNFTYVVKRNF